MQTELCAIVTCARLAYSSPRTMIILRRFARHRTRSAGSFKEEIMPETIKCTHCGEKRPALPFAPFPNELGQRIAAEICQPCWSGRPPNQTQIINHYGLDLTNPDAQTSLFDNIKGYLFGDAPKVAEIDTTKEGSVKW